MDDLKLKWVIGSDWDAASFYSNSGEWVEYNTAGFFTDEDKERLKLPESGVWYSIDHFIKYTIDAHNEDGTLKERKYNAKI